MKRNSGEHLYSTTSTRAAPCGSSHLTTHVSPKSRGALGQGLAGSQSRGLSELQHAHLGVGEVAVLLLLGEVRVLVQIARHHAILEFHGEGDLVGADFLLDLSDVPGAIRACRAAHATHAQRTRNARATHAQRNARANATRARGRV